jgi:3-dehydroquinate synthase
MGIKNYVGTITQPDFVLSDFRVFETLNERDVLNGWMEMTKHGLIASAALWNKMKEFKRIPKPSEMHSLIEDASTIKKQLVEADEFEFGLRKTLNFGHTVGHALESVATAQNKGLPHGIAVGLGMMCSLHWSASRAESQDIEGELISASKCIEQWLLAEVPGTVRAIVEGVDLTTLWSFMKKDKKNDALGVQEILLREIGQATWNEPLSFADFETSWSNALGGS